MNKKDVAVGKDHIFWEYFNANEGGVGHHEAAALIYNADVVYTALMEINRQLEDIAGTLRQMRDQKNPPAEG